MNHKGIAVGIVLLFLVSTAAPMILAQTYDTPQKESYDAYLPHSYLTRYNPTDDVHADVGSVYQNQGPITSDLELSNEKGLLNFDSGLMDSAWPMYCHDTQHTGRSPYSTTDNPPGVIKWCFNTHGLGYYGSTIIDSDGVIYTAADGIYALYPNGTLIWQYDPGGWFESCPALANDGTIYIGSAYAENNYFFAFNPNGTIKWRYGPGENIFSSPVIGDDGTLYYGGQSNSINALWPNGTQRWRYQTDHVVYSSPVIGDDGTIYCGCHDSYLYALYLNNGTLKWRFQTGDSIRVSPCIGDDGTVYCVSWDGYLYAIRPNGTMKWRTWVEAGTSPTIGVDGTIYAGWSKLYALNPDGSVKWTYDTGGCIQGGTPCTSADGTIYFGTRVNIIYGYLVALNPDGTECWKTFIGKCESSPAIADDGTIYIGGVDNNNSKSYLYAFGKGLLKAEANGPYKTTYNQPVKLTGRIFGGIPSYACHWDFGDGTSSEEQNPTHTYTTIGNFTVTFSVEDSEGNQSNGSSYVLVSAIPPSLLITKPVNGIYFIDKRLLPASKPIIIGQVTIQVEAAQEPFGIDRVEFYIDGNLRTTDIETPFQWTWNSIAFFKHTIKVIAYDTSGKSTEKSIDVSKFF